MIRVLLALDESVASFRAAREGARRPKTMMSTWSSSEATNAPAGPRRERNRARPTRPVVGGDEHPGENLPAVQRTADKREARIGPATR